MSIDHYYQRGLYTHWVWTKNVPDFDHGQFQFEEPHSYSRCDAEWDLLDNGHPMDVVEDLRDISLHNFLTICWMVYHLFR